MSESPITNVQFAPQVAILNSLAHLLQRPGGAYTLNIPIREVAHVVHIGHSFGAFVAAAALATTPKTTTQPAPGHALILTGLSGRFEWLSLSTAGGLACVAALQFPEKLAHLPFKSPFFDRRVTEWLYENQSPYVTLPTYAFMFPSLGSSYNGN
ncbi:hypothetical protein VTI74DRAFT_6913 [Chaetomium olivicolor]